MTRQCAHPARPVLAAAVAAALGVAAAVTPRAFAPRVTAQVPGTPVPPCVFETARDVVPRRLDLGAEAAVTLTMAADCPVDPRPLHLVLAVDASAEGSELQLRSLQDSLGKAVRAIGLAGRTGIEIGVVAFGDTGGAPARIKSFLSAEEPDVLAAIRDIEHGGQPALAEGLWESWLVLRQGRRDLENGDVREVILLASVGIDPSGCDPVRSRAFEVKRFGVTLVTACAGACDRRCLEETASLPRFALRGERWDYLEYRLQELVRSTGRFHPVDRVSIVDALSPNLAYVHGDPPSQGQGNDLQWTFTGWTTEVLTFTYQVRAMVCGTFKSSRRVGAEITYTNGLTEALPFGNPRLDVPCPTPTATQVISTTATSTAATPTAGHTATPTPLPPTPPRPAPPVYLPVALRLDCAAVWPAADVVLAVDVSGSMAVADVPGHENRWSAARSLARAMAGRLGPGDRVGLLAFAASHSWLVPLEGEDGRAAAGRALDPACPPQRAGCLPRMAGSRLDLAVGEAARVLESRGRPGATPVLVVLTDGDPNQTHIADLLESATAARAAGTVVHTVIVGADAVSAHLVEMSGTVERVHRLDSLAAIDRLAPIPRCSR